MNLFKKKNQRNAWEGYKPEKAKSGSADWIWYDPSGTAPQGGVGTSGVGGTSGGGTSASGSSSGSLGAGSTGAGG